MAFIPPPFYSQMLANHPNLVLWIPLIANGNATVGGLNGTLSGSNGTYNFNSSGIFAKCLNLQPTGDNTFNGYDYAYANNALFECKPNKTIMLTLKIDTASYSATAYSNNTGTKGILVGNANNGVRWTLVGDGGSNPAVELGNANYSLADRLHCLAYTSTAINDHKLYYDGRLMSQSTSSWNNYSDGSAYLGADGYSGGIFHWKGLLSNLLVFNKAFSAAEVFAYGGALLN